MRHIDTYSYFQYNSFKRLCIYQNEDCHSDKADKKPKQYYMHS